jgi:hypothetical protein
VYEIQIFINVLLSLDFLFSSLLCTIKYINILCVGPAPNKTY